MASRFSILTFLCLSLALRVTGQDPQFSQFFANPLSLNPAFAGTSELGRAVTSYRNQWPRQGVTYVTYTASYDDFSDRLNTGWGVQVMHDRQLNQLIKVTNASLFYSYHLKLGDYSFLSAGLQAGVIYKQLDPSRLIFPSMIDQLTGTISGLLPGNLEFSEKYMPDFSVGTIGQFRDFFGGISLHHLTQPDETLLEGDQEGRLPLKVTLHAGARSHHLHRGLLSRQFTISPNLIYQQQGSFRQLNAGIYMIEPSVMFGIWYRNNLSVRPDALIFLAGLANDRFQLGYSFDYTLSGLSDYSHGSHEISLTFRFGQLKGFPDPRRLLIPPI